MFIFMATCIIWFAASSPVLEASTLAVHCEFGGNSFDVGEVWHPELPPFGVMECVNCTCKTDGLVSCDTEECPPLRCKKQVTPPGECCPVCKSALQDNFDDNMIPEIRKERDSCNHGDSIYQHEQVFASEVSGIRPRRNDQCVVCLCLDGDVLCQLKTCHPPTCTAPVVQNGDCCPSCPGDSDEGSVRDSNSSRHDFGLTPGNRGTVPNTCSAHSEERWNPEIGAFGVMPCVICSCETGAATCRRFWCPEKRFLPCQNPTRAMGQCCYTCPQTDTDRCRTSDSETSVVARAQLRNYYFVFIQHHAMPARLYEWTASRGSVSDIKQITMTSQEAENLITALSGNAASDLGIIRKKVILKNEKKLEKLVRRCPRRQCPRRQLEKVVNRLALTAC